MYVVPSSPLFLNKHDIQGILKYENVQIIIRSTDICKNVLYIVLLCKKKNS